MFRPWGIGRLRFVPLGRVSEWFMDAVLKTAVAVRLPWVRIPPLPHCMGILSVFSDGAAKMRCAERSGRKQAAGDSWARGLSSINRDPFTKFRGGAVAKGAKVTVEIR